MKGGLPGGTLQRVNRRSESRRPTLMLHAGLDLSRRRLDVCLVNDAGELVEQTAAAPDADGLRRLVERLRGVRVRAVIESMTGARFVHDTLEELGWEVLVADAQKVKGLAPLACKTDRIDARVLAELSWRDLVPAIWLPDPSIRRERELARYRLHLVRHRTTLKNRIHATLMTFGHPCPVSDLFGLAGRELLDRLALPDPPLAQDRRREPGAHRRPRAADRLADRRDAPPGRRSPLHPAAGHRAGVRLDQRVHRRLGDRRHQPLRLAGQALRLHRPLPARLSVGQHRPARPDLQERLTLPALGALRGRAARLQPPRLPRALPAHQAPPRPPARIQGRPDRPVPQAHRGDLAHAHPQPALRSGRRRFSSSRLTALNGIAPPERLPFSGVPVATRLWS